MVVIVQQSNARKKTNVKTFCFFILVTFTLAACGQTKNNRTTIGKSYAQQELKLALTDKGLHNVIDNKTITIKESLTAINVAEPILFSIYGKDNIIKQRPYEVYFIDNYWVIAGTLPEDYLGGTFLIIVDATNSKIIRLTHGK
jgi:NTF2 fold immunity protein